MNTQREGRVICFDGPDGVGKTVQLELAADYLREQGEDVYTTRKSGGTPIGALLREVSLSGTPRDAEVDLAISLAMGTTVGLDIAERKRDGQICLVDRCPLAVLAYNIEGGMIADKAWGYTIVDRLLKLWEIDTIFVFNASLHTLKERRSTRDKANQHKSDYFESKGDDYHRRVMGAYLQSKQYIADRPELGIKVIEVDAEDTIEAIHEVVKRNLL